jgi:diguanylate cyclase
LAARYSDTMLGLVLTNTARPTAAAVADSIRRAFASEPVQCVAGRVATTASVGVASLDAGTHVRDSSTLPRAAELAVHAAKRSGRNSVRVYTASRPVERPTGAAATEGAAA